MSGEKDEPARHGPMVPDPHALEDFYRKRAAECIREAEAATDPKQRQQWKRLAFEWTQLALHVK